MEGIVNYKKLNIWVRGNGGIPKLRKHLIEKYKSFHISRLVRGRENWQEVDPPHGSKLRRMIRGQKAIDFDLLLLVVDWLNLSGDSVVLGDVLTEKGSHFMGALTERYISEDN